MIIMRDIRCILAIIDSLIEAANDSRELEWDRQQKAYYRGERDGLVELRRLLVSEDKESEEET